MHLFIVPKVPAQYVRAREGGAPIMLAPLWSRAAHEPSGLWTWPGGTEPLVGAIVNNRFVIEGYIASGSYGHGWKAIDLQDKKPVFLKTPRASHDYMPSDDDGGAGEGAPGTMRRILHTIPKHKSLVNVIEVTPPHAPKPCATPSGVSAPIHYFACDLCEGGDLFGYVSTQPLEPMREPVVAHIFRQLMEALEFLHGRNLFHRDLKTENILVSREDGKYTLKVADFGRTVFVPPQPSETGEGPYIHEQFSYDNGIFPAEAVRGGAIGSEVVAAGRHVPPPSRGRVGRGTCATTAHRRRGACPDQAQHRRRAAWPRRALRAPLQGRDPDRPALQAHRPGGRSPELDQLFRAMVHKDPMMRPSAEEVLACDWMKKADEVTEAEVVAAFESERPVSEEAHNTMSVTCAPRLKDTATAFDALIEALQVARVALARKHPAGGVRGSRTTHRDGGDGRDAHPRHPHPGGRHHRQKPHRGVRPGHRPGGGGEKGALESRQRDNAAEQSCDSCGSAEARARRAATGGAGMHVSAILST